MAHEHPTKGATAARRTHRHRSGRALAAAKGHLKRRALEALGYAVVAYLIVRLVPSLKQGLRSLEHVRWQWVVLAIAIEIVSETGFVVSWKAIVDPDDLLCSEGRGQRIATRVAWVQLGGGILVPGGSLSSVGVGAWILHRFGLPTKLIAERQFNLQFLNTGIDALALVVFGLGLAIGILPGEQRLTLTLLPALVAAVGLAGALLIAKRGLGRAKRLQDAHPKIAAAIDALANAVEDTERLLTHRAGLRSVLGAVAYLGFDVLVLWSAFLALNTHPMPSFAIVLMSYIIGALGGSIPLPAGAGSIGGMIAVLILYGVPHEPAVVAVFVYQAIGQIVPLVGGGISYLFLRGQFGPVETPALEASDS